MKTFEELGLSKNLLELIKKAGFKKPSEIQEKVLPLAIKGKDIIGGSATGSGKTLAFAAPIIEQLKPNDFVQALILTPTRELAEQISQEFQKFSENKKLNILAVYGGVSIENQIKKLAKTDIVVGTPGRILDHMNRGSLSLRKVKFLVLDEVDRMFDMGFFDDVNRILKECPKDKQTMLFSATISEDVYYLAKNYTKNPAKITVKSYVDPTKLEQIYYDVPDHDKFSLLVYLLKKEQAKLVLVFCSTRKNVEFVTQNLIAQKINALAIHGGMDQNKRIKALEIFHKSGGVLICTDVAARGLDIKNVSHVYNYDLPKTSEEYIHRVGRTARAGKTGIAINIVASRDYENFSNVQIDEKLKIKKEKTPRFGKIWVNTSAFKDKRKSGPSRNRDYTRRRSNFRSRSYSKGGSGSYSPRRNSSSQGRGFSRGGSSSESRNYSRGRNNSRLHRNFRDDSRSRPKKSFGRKGSRRNTSTFKGGPKRGRR